MNNQKQFTDPMMEARKSKSFTKYSKTARVAVRLAAEVHDKRKQRGWSQIDLANNIGTTQKVISNIESGDVDVGIGLLKRLVDGLSLTTEDLGNIFESCCLFSFNNSAANTELVYNRSPYQFAKNSTANNINI